MTKLARNKIPDSIFLESDNFLLTKGLNLKEVIKSNVRIYEDKQRGSLVIGKLITKRNNELELLKLCQISKFICEIVKDYKINEDVHVFLIPHYNYPNLDTLRKSDLSIKQIKYISHQILLGLDFIHKKRVIHRDIKGGNIVQSDIAKNNMIPVRIIDFDMATVCDVNNRAVGVCGTKFYKAPEMRKNKPYDFKIDVFSTGVLIFKLVTILHFPFDVTPTGATDTTKSLDFKSHKKFHQQKNLIFLLKKMLKPKPKSRFSIRECLESKFIKRTSK